MLSGLTVSFGPGRTGLIGVNGSGKSTLLRLIAGELRPASGTVRAAGDVGYLPQAITLGTHRTVSDLLGITAARDALHAIEAGETGEEAFAAVGDDWDVEERARAWLDRLGLPLALDDRVERLSGGETVLVALAALFLRRPDILLLDEPTNNLDLDARLRLYDAVASWTGVMVIVSHDRELLGRVDQIADLSGGEPPDVRRQPGRLRGAARGRAGRRGTRRHRSRGRRPPASTATWSTPRSSRPAGTGRAARPPPRAACPGSSRTPASDPPRKPPAGSRNCTPSACRPPAAAWTRPSTPSGTTPRSASTCPPPPSRPAAPS